MRQQLLDAYWSVVRDGLSCTQAAEERIIVTTEVTLSLRFQHEQYGTCTPFITSFILTFGDDFWRCCAFDMGCAGTDTALWQLFCPRGLVFFVLQDFYSWQYSAKNCQSFGVKRPKNMDLKTSFAINQICIIAKLCLISMSHQFA